MTPRASGTINLARRLQRRPAGGDVAHLRLHWSAKETNPRPARVSKQVRLKWKLYRIWIFERSIGLCAAKC